MHLPQPTRLQIAKIKGHHSHVIDRPGLDSEAYAEQIDHIDCSQQHSHAVAAVVVHHPQGRGTGEFTRLLAVAVVQGLRRGGVRHNGYKGGNMGKGLGYL